MLECRSRASGVPIQIIGTEVEEDAIQWRELDSQKNANAKGGQRRVNQKAKSKSPISTEPHVALLLINGRLPQLKRDPKGPG